MTVSQSWALQQAIHARLTAQLAGQGPASSDVTVYDSIPEDPSRLHVRLDDIGVFPGRAKCNSTRHVFQVNVYDGPTTENSAARGKKTAKVLQQTIYSALNGWTPSVTGASAVQYEEGPFPVGDASALTTGLATRFSVHIGA